MGRNVGPAVIQKVSQLYHGMGDVDRLASNHCFFSVPSWNNTAERDSDPHDDYSPKPYQAMLLGWAVTAFAVVINTIGSKTLAHFEGVILILHILGFFAILIPLVYLAPHNDASIFITFVNTGGWSTQGLSFMVGLPSSIFALVGEYDVMQIRRK